MLTQTITKLPTANIVLPQPLFKAESQGERMYAIAFDMDIESLRLNYGDPYNNAYAEIGRI
jgi:hypothetical protein